MHDPIIKTKKEISVIFSTLLLKKKENKKNSNKLIQIRKKGKEKCKEEGCNVNKKKKKNLSCTIIENVSLVGGRGQDLALVRGGKTLISRSHEVGARPR